MTAHEGTWHELHFRHEWQQVAHLQNMMGDVAGVVVVASNEEVGEHALERELLQQEMSLPLAANQLMDEQSRFYQVIDPVPAD